MSPPVDASAGGSGTSDRSGGSGGSGESQPRPRRNTRPRDGLGRPLPYGSAGVEPQPEGVKRTPGESLREAHRLLVASRPFHAHEVLEDAWKSAPADERELWRGLAQLAVGLTHAARGNAVGGARLVGRGARTIAEYRSATPHGLDVDALLAWAAGAVADIDAGGAVHDAPPLIPPA